MPKRQVSSLHPRLTYKRPGLDDVHRPSINLKNLIKPVDLNADYNPPKQEIKSLPVISGYKSDKRPGYAYKEPSLCPHIPPRPAQVG